MLTKTPFSRSIQKEIYSTNKYNKTKTQTTITGREFGQALEQEGKEILPLSKQLSYLSLTWLFFKKNSWQWLSGDNIHTVLLGTRSRGKRQTHYLWESYVLAFWKIMPLLAESIARKWAATIFHYYILLPLSLQSEYTTPKWLQMMNSISKFWLPAIHYPDHS